MRTVQGAQSLADLLAPLEEIDFNLPVSRTLDDGWPAFAFKSFDAPELTSAEQAQDDSVERATPPTPDHVTTCQCSELAEQVVLLNAARIEEASSWTELVASVKAECAEYKTRVKALEYQLAQQPTGPALVLHASVCSVMCCILAFITSH